MKHVFIKFLFILAWPLTFMYAPLKVRSRILVIKNGKYIAVTHKFGNNFYSLPGGGVKRGETHKDAAIRELHEELAIQIAPNQVHQLLAEKTYNERGHFMRYVIFVVQIQGSVTLQPNHEIDQVRWLNAQASHTANHVKAAIAQAKAQGYLIK